MINSLYFFTLFPYSFRCGDDPRQRDQPLVPAGAGGFFPRFPVGQGFHPVQYANGNFSPANRALPSVFPCLPRLPTNTTGPVSVPMVFTLFRKKLYCA